MMRTAGPAFLPLGDAALLIEYGGGIEPDTHALVRDALAALDAAVIPGVTDLVPAYTGIAVHYDPRAFHAPGAAASPFERVCAAVAAALAQPVAAAVRTPRTLEIGVRYGGEHGPDLAVVARHTGLDPAAVAALHAAAEYTVHVIGFSPGFPYLAGLPAQLATPRRAEPRTRVAAGSVGIAGMQTGIYPLASPGGWQIIGRTDVRLFDPAADPPALLRVGDRVRFVAVP